MCSQTGGYFSISQHVKLTSSVAESTQLEGARIHSRSSQLVVSTLCCQTLHVLQMLCQAPGNGFSSISLSLSLLIQIKTGFFPSNNFLAIIVFRLPLFFPCFTLFWSLFLGDYFAVIRRDAASSRLLSLHLEAAIHTRFPFFKALRREKNDKNERDSKNKLLTGVFVTSTPTDVFHRGQY